MYKQVMKNMFHQSELFVSCYILLAHKILACLKYFTFKLGVLAANYRGGL